MLPKISSPSGSEDETFSFRERATQGCRCRHPTRADYTQLMALISHGSCCGHPRIIVPSSCSNRLPSSQSMSVYKGHDDYKENDRGNCRNSFQSIEGNCEHKKCIHSTTYQQKQRMAGQIAFRSCTEEIQ
jgi:hypothetical protein